MVSVELACNLLVWFLQSLSRISFLQSAQDSEKMDCFGFMDVHFVLFIGTSPAVSLLPGSDWNCHVSPEQQLSLP